ncbi:MAG: nuclear transport factor 2 family protein [Gammaproteobacteria bacterium]|nr:nuclear transport factor 2 family protein [Gammaproteobacteria bacterium]
MQLSFEQRITRLEDYEAIKVIIATFSRGADAGCDPTILRPIFCDDAIFDIGQFGVLEGGDHIVNEMHNNTDIGFNWTLHYLISPVIEIQDDLNTAQCFYYLWETATHPTKQGKEDSYWIGGWYDATAVKEKDGKWRFKHLKLTVKLMSTYAEGWKPVPGSFDELG